MAFSSSLVTTCSQFLILWTAITVAQHVQEIPDKLDTSSCIPLMSLEDSIVQRDFGELRKIRQVRLYLSGKGSVEVTVSVAKNVSVPELTHPILHQCGFYRGPLSDIMITISCLEENGDPDGFPGLAVYAKFESGYTSSELGICQMDIVLHDKYADRKKQSAESMAIFFGILISLMILAGIGVLVWYYITIRSTDMLLMKDDDSEDSVEEREVEKGDQQKELCEVGDDDVFLAD